MLGCSGISLEAGCTLPSYNVTCASTPHNEFALRAGSCTRYCLGYLRRPRAAPRRTHHPSIQPGCRLNHRIYILNNLRHFTRIPRIFALFLAAAKYFFFYLTSAVLFYVISGMWLLSSKKEEHELIKRHSEKFVSIHLVLILLPSCIPKKSKLK